MTDDDFVGLAGEGMALIDAPVAPLSFTPTRVVAEEPPVVPGVVAGGLKRVPEYTVDDEGVRHMTGRVLHLDDAGTAHPVVGAPI